MLVHRSYVRRIAAIGYFVAMAAITIGSLTPPRVRSSSFEHSDWLVHFGAYLVAGTLACAGFTDTRVRRWSLVALLLLGVVIELLQPHVGRSGSGADLIANLAGALSAVALGNFAPIRRIRSS